MVRLKSHAMAKSGRVAMRAEKGHLRDDDFFPANALEIVLLIDSWENQEAIDVHYVTDDGHSSRTARKIRLTHDRRTLPV